MLQPDVESILKERHWSTVKLHWIGLNVVEVSLRDTELEAEGVPLHSYRSQQIHQHTQVSLGEDFCR
jgi:hypothetical protein